MASRCQVELRHKSFLEEHWEMEPWDIVWVASLCMRRTEIDVSWGSLEMR